MVTTYTVSGASGAYKFALPAKDQDHLAFLSVTVDKKELEFEPEASPSEELVMYSVDLGQAEGGTKIAVGIDFVCYCHLRVLVFVGARARACVCPCAEHRLR